MTSPIINYLSGSISAHPNDALRTETATPSTFIKRVSPPNDSISPQDALSLSYRVVTDHPIGTGAVKTVYLARMEEDRGESHSDEDSTDKDTKFNTPTKSSSGRRLSDAGSPLALVCTSIQPGFNSLKQAFMALHEFEILKELQAIPGIIGLECSSPRTLYQGGTSQMLVLMEMCDQGNLREWANGKTLLKRLKILQQVAKTLEVMHSKYQIVHGDIKPENIGIKTNEEGLSESRLLDFGCADRVCDMPSFGKGPIYQDTKGTPAYNAPACLHPEKKDSFQKDIFSFAATIYEVVADTIIPARLANDVLALHSSSGKIHAYMNRSKPNDFFHLANSIKDHQFETNRLGSLLKKMLIHHHFISMKHVVIALNRIVSEQELLETRAKERLEKALSKKGKAKTFERRGNINHQDRTQKF